MTSIITACIVACIALAAGASGAYIYVSSEHRQRELERRVADLEAERAERNAILADAQGRRRAHHAYSTLAAIEDATSLLLDAGMDNAAERARIETALGILTTLREGPGAYNPDRGLSCKS
jgi:hypothetical protein